MKASGPRSHAVSFLGQLAPTLGTIGQDGELVSIPTCGAAEPDTGCGLHGRPHLPDQPLHPVSCEVRRLDRIGRPAQYRISTFDNGEQIGRTHPRHGTGRVGRRR